MRYEVTLRIIEDGKRREKKKRIRGRGSRREGQANKGTGRMPGYQEPKKDVTSCEKLRGDANSLGAVDIRMRELTY